MKKEEQMFLTSLSKNSKKNIKCQESVNNVVKLLTPKECFPIVKSIRYIIIFKLLFAFRDRETNKIF